MITLEQYWMGRDSQYPDDFVVAVRVCGAVTVRRVNALLDLALLDGVPLTNVVASGWRPVAVNDATSHAAGHSRHITAQACDIRDTDNRDLARWCVKNAAKLEFVELWCEDFRWTGGEGHQNWVHFQTVAPLSGKRFFVPSSAAPLDPDFGEA